MAWTDSRLRTGGARKLRTTAALTGVLMVFGGVLEGLRQPGKRRRDHPLCSE